jgi:hypothetical protein
MSGSVSSSGHDERVEEWGPINAMLAEFTSESRVGSAVARRSLRGHWPVEGDTELGGDQSPEIGERRPDLLVVASGNLAMLTSSDQVHRQLVHWLETYGRRSRAQDAVAETTTVEPIR